MIKSGIKKAFNKLGYSLERFDETRSLTMNAAIARCVQRGVKVNTIVDVGASDGRWTRDCMRYLPDANYLLIEAQDPHRENLEKLRREKTQVDFVLAAAGNKEGKIYFDNSALFGGLASDNPLKGGSIEVPVVTIDNELKKRKLAGPYAIKLDTHGYEVPILEGAAETLKNASLVIIEVYNYQLTPTSLRYFEMCQYMKNLGFLSVELVDFVLRDRDSSFWQMDAFFIPEKSAGFSHNSFD
jgi:FkbM family methyltransferase